MPLAISLFCHSHYENVSKLFGANSSEIPLEKLIDIWKKNSNYFLLFKNLYK